MQTHDVKVKDQIDFLVKPEGTELYLTQLKLATKDCDLDKTASQLPSLTYKHFKLQEAFQKQICSQSPLKPENSTESLLNEIEEHKKVKKEEQNEKHK